MGSGSRLGKLRFRCGARPRARAIHMAGVVDTTALAACAAGAHDEAAWAAALKPEWLSFDETCNKPGMHDIEI